MNVTVQVPQTLRAAMEGRESVELGVPPGATVADVFETLLKLYPRLRGHVASERKDGQNELQLFLGEQPVVDWAARRRPGLREGQTVYLFASSPRRVSAPPV